MNSHFFKILSISIILCHFIQSCGPKQSDLEKDRSKKIVEISFKDVVDDKKLLQAIIDPIDVVFLETSKECFISYVDKIEHFNDKYFILDSNLNNLFAFDKGGAFLNKIGNQGHGPGEYIDVADFCIDKKRNLVLALSVEKRSIYEYSIEGKHIRTIKFPFQSNGISTLGDSEIAHYLGYYDKDNKNLKITNSKSGDLLFSYFDFPESTYAINLLSVTGNITTNYLGCLYSDATSSYIHQIMPDGKTYAKYHIEFENSFWPEDRKYELKSFFKEVQNGQLNFLTNNYEENENALVFGYNRKVVDGSEIVVQRHNAYFIKSNKSLYTNESLTKDLLSSVISEPLGLTQENKFISVIIPVDYYSSQNKFGMKAIGEELTSAIKHVKPGDNPIIYIYDVSHKK